MGTPRRKQIRAQTFITPRATPPASSWWMDGGTREEWYARAQYEHDQRMDASRSPSWSDAPRVRNGGRR